jgi:hypothetical protein
MIKLLDLLREFLKSDIQDGADIQRTNRGNGVTVKYKGSNKRTKTAVFNVTDPNGSGKVHEVRVQFPDYSQVSRQRKGITREQKVELALEAGDLKINCSCPDYLYKGFKYMATELDYGIRKEARPPDVMNPDREGTVCKHTLGVFNHINNFVTEISEDLKW